MHYVLFKGDRTTGGQYIQGGTVLININSGQLSTKNLGAATVSHELTHYLQDFAPEEYEQLKGFITQHIMKKSPAQFDALVRQQQKLDPKLSYDKAVDELVANACQKMLLNSRAVTQLARQNMTLAERIQDAIADISEKIKAAFEGVDLKDDVRVYQAAREISDVMDQVQELWDKALLAADASYNAVEQTGMRSESDTSGEMLKSVHVDKGPSAKGGDKRTAAYVLANHIDDIKDMQTVASLTGKEMNDRSKDLPTQIEEFFESVGGQVEREGLGTVILGEYGVGGVMNHKPLNRAKLVTLTSVPEVIQRGRIINYDPNWKGRGYPSLIIAAPVDVDGQTIYVAAVIDQRGDYKFYLNECVDSEGNYIRITEDPSDNTKSGVTAQDGVTRGSDGSSDVSITDTSEKSKPQNLDEEQHQRWDTTGAELTEGQQRYFADSKIRDADGRLKVMYRGGNGDFTVFDRKKSSYSNLYGRGFYFTEDKAHAEQYGRARAFYLNITNPLTPGSKTITRKQLRAFLQEVADNEDYGIENYGYDATVDSILAGLKGKDDFSALQDINTTCIGDLVAAVELFNEVNGTDFDGIVTPTETVTFASEQSKETSNQNPTSDPDIQHQRWGMAETEEEREARRESVANLRAENRILRARAEYWRNQTRQTREKTVRQQDTDHLANALLKKYESKTDKAEVKSALKDLGDWLVQSSGDNLTYDELRDRAEAIAEDIVDGNYALIDDSQSEMLSRLKDYLKSTPVNLSSADWRDTGDEHFRRRYGRYFTVSERGRTIDSLWGELSATFGESLFPEDTYAPGDMLNMIGDYLDLWKPQYGNVFEQYRGEAVDAAANEIIDAMLGEEVRQSAATYADRAQQRLNAQIAKDKDRLDALREQKNARIEEIKRQAAEKIKATRYAEKAAKYEAVSRTKQHYRDMMQRQRDKRSDTAVRQDHAGHGPLTGSPR